MSVFRPIKAIKDSKLYLRLVALEEAERTESAHEDGEVAKLMLNVKAVVKNAEIISEHVITHMPQYTLHNGRHLWNVLSYAEELAGESIEEFSALECALLIMAVFVHDLGMVPDAEEVRAWEDSNAKTPEAEAWQTYCAGHPLWTQREKLSVEKEKERKQLLGKVRADYLRETHADEAKPLGGLNRINRWLERLEGFDPKLLEYRGLNYRGPLALLAMSHGQSVDWLPERLTTCKEVSLEKGDVYHHDVGGEHINWPYLSWMLRLADIMDFDASRTPAVVFEHLGIDDAVSVREWQKHLSIASVSFLADAEGPKVRYVCNKCPSPRVEKAIHEFVGWINLELGHVATEQARGSRHYESRKETLQLKLPEKAEVKINAREGNYEYLDVSFTLERDAVMELLMGEALYGDHNLALRELVQNALDALHLRDMRSQLREKLREAGGLHEAPPVEPVGASEKLEVHVTWGHDAHGRAWIKVKDNGVGMTKGQIEKFLTRIGKSYYKSPEFKREQKLMKEHGLLCTTISQFGIGFLSSFMLADKVEVVTRAGGRVGDDEHTRRVVVDGPHGMIAIYPVAGGEGGFSDGTGTEVTLWLKGELKFEPWDREAVIYDLRYHHYEIGKSEKCRKRYSDVIDPALEVGKYFIWPLYTVSLEEAAMGEMPFVLDEQFHFQELLPINVGEVDRAAVECGSPEIDLTKLDWDPVTWTDSKATGSRVRYAVPRAKGCSQDFETWKNRPNLMPKGVSQALLQSIVELQLPKRGRMRMLVNGVHVPEFDEYSHSSDLREILDELAERPGVGGICWWDLRGEATMRLRADRQAPTRLQDEVTMQMQRDMLRRAADALKPEAVDSWRWLNHAMGQGVACPEIGGIESDWANQVNLPFDPMLWSCCVTQGLRWERRFQWETENVERGLCLSLLRAHAIGKKISKKLTLIHSGCDLYQITMDFTRALAISLGRGIDADNLTEVAIEEEYGLDFCGNLVDACERGARLCSVYPTDTAYTCFVSSNWLSEAFWPSVEAGVPFLKLAGAKGRLSQLYLLGPMELSSISSEPPGWLAVREYDLIAPWTGVPLGRLRQLWPADDNEHERRARLILPFLFGEEILKHVPLDQLSGNLEVPDLLMWMPHPRQMGWRFDDESHTVEDWNEGSLSALWDIEKGTVVYAPGLHDRESIRKEGVSLNKLLGMKK
ncbi:ATP-binding protein [Verrucomicrobium sp. BvORR034]|uniref:HD domain-containing protein n=1 Tax=Verrucomicrobium sp. BvORR034 TaxID=1396418 RepID=UPI0006789380|nr:ATP-binding protein [Verrucomicrobium sp. BvORR034]